MIFIVCLHILRIHVRCTEDRFYGDFNACLDPHALSSQCTKFPFFQTPTHSTHVRHFFDCISSTVYRSPYCQTVLNADGNVETVSCLRLFYLFPHTSFNTLFTFAHPFFLLPVVPSFSFHRAFSLFPSLRAFLSSSPTLFFCALH